MSKIRFSFLLSALLLLLSSCTKDGFDSFNNLAAISTFNAISTSKGFDIYIDNNRLNSYSENFDYGTYISYQSIFPGNRLISIVQPGFNLKRPLVSKPLKFEENKYYTLVLTGTQNIEYLLIEDEITPPERGKVSLRFIHLSPDSPELSLQLDEEIPAQFAKFMYKEVSPFLEFDAGSIRANIHSSNTNFKPINFEYTFLDQGIYTVYVKGLSNVEDKAQQVSYSVVKY